MQLRYLKDIELYKSSKIKQDNGSYIEEYEKISDYKVQFEEITDEASASIYGATVNKMYRISSPNNKLEKHLHPKINDTSDNISKYYIKYNQAYYKITTVKRNWIDIEYKESITYLSI